MFDDYGRPDDGYGQNQPFTDVPNYSRPPERQEPQQDSPLQTAVAGRGAPQYPADPHMQRWRTRQPGPQHKIPRYAPPDNPEATGDLLSGGLPGGNTGIAGGLQLHDGFGQQTPEAHLAVQPGQPGAYRGSLTGFDNTKLNNGHDTTKYRAAHVFEQFAPSQENMPAVLAALKAAGLNVDQVGKDSFDFHDGYGPVDAGVAFGTNDPNQMKWGWQVKQQQQPQSGNTSLLSAINGTPQPQQDDPQAFYQQLLQQFMQQVQQ